MQEKTGRANIRLVAERAQVSRSTASRVARGYRHQVNEETYERVIGVMRELNYIPVRTGLQNRHVDTNTIGVVPMHRDPSNTPIDSKTLEGLCAGASRQGRDVLIMLRGEAEWMANRNELQFLDRRTDGFIFISPGLDDWGFALETLCEHGMPAVVCYRREVPEGVAWVDPDNEGIIRLGIECHRSHGHQRIAYIAGPKCDSVANAYLADINTVRFVYDDVQRQRYFAAMMGGDGPMIHVTDPKWQVTAEDFQGLLDSGATAVICVNDYVALQVWKLARAAGLSVPGNLAILGVDDEHGAAESDLTSVVFGYDAVGRLATEAWLELRNGKAPQECCKIVPAQLVERGSTGPSVGGPSVTGPSVGGLSVTGPSG